MQGTQQMPSSGAFSRILRRISATRVELGDVAAGDRFFERGEFDVVWVVERLIKPRGVGIEHVVIRHWHSGFERRMVAKSALLDMRRFGRDRRDPCRNLSAKSPRRRRTDPPCRTDTAVETGTCKELR